MPRWRPMLILLLLLAACGGGEKAPPSGPPAPEPTLPLATIWKWTGVEAADPARVDHPGRYTLEFLPDRRYSVRADCNSGSGSWTREDGVLSLGPAALTTAACDPGSLADRYLQLLSQARGFEADGDSLQLQVDATTRMHFVAMRRLELAGSSWVVRACNNGQMAVVSVIGDADLTLEFGSDGRLSGSGGCNRFHADYESSGQVLSVGPVASTRRICMDERLSEQEDRFLRALATAATWEVRAERAQLRTADGALAVDLVSAVTGTVTLPSPGALPPDAVLKLRLLDTSRADAPSVVLGESSFAVGASPVRFQLPFDPAEIDPAHSYAVRATLAAADTLLMTTAEVTPVITGGHGQFGISLELLPVGE